MAEETADLEFVDGVAECEFTCASQNELDGFLRAFTLDHSLTIRTKSGDTHRVKILRYTVSQIPGFPKKVSTLFEKALRYD